MHDHAHPQLPLLLTVPRLAVVVVLEVVHVRHFTAAWEVKALVSAGVPATHPAVSSAVAQVWRSYGGDTASLWAWDNGDMPIWMTFDAIDALRLANLAVPARPSWSPPL